MRRRRRKAFNPWYNPKKTGLFRRGVMWRSGRWGAQSSEFCEAFRALEGRSRPKRRQLRTWTMLNDALEGWLFEPDDSKKKKNTLKNTFARRCISDP